MGDLISNLSNRPNVYDTRPAKPAAAKSATKPAGPRPQPLYFVNPVVDFVFAGGASVLVYAAMAGMVAAGTMDGGRTTWAITLGAQLLLVCNWPHFSATNYRLYHSRDAIGQYPFTALGVPPLVLAAMAAAVYAPTIVAPYFVKLFLLWSSYHFSGQTVGVTLIYARRAGFPVGKWERRGLAWFVYGTFLVAATGADALRPDPSRPGEYAPPVQGKFFGIPTPVLGLPHWLPELACLGMFAGGIVFLALAARWSFANRRALPLIVLVPAAAQFTWFYLGIYYKGGIAAFNEYVPFFHSLQYLLIAWSMQLKEKLDKQNITPSVRYVVGESARWGAINFVGGFCLFLLFPMAVYVFGTADQSLSVADRLRLAALMGLEFLATAFPSLKPELGAFSPQMVEATRYSFLFAMGVALCAVQIHHFFVDGVIWKLKRTTVASPLMVNIEDLIGPRRATR